MYARAKREIFLWGRVTYTYTIAKRKIFLGREGGGVSRASCLKLKWRRRRGRDVQREMITEGRQSDRLLKHS